MHNGKLAIVAILDYVAHTEDCASREYDVRSPYSGLINKCDCGLDELLVKAGEELKKLIGEQ